MVLASGGGPSGQHGISGSWGSGWKEGECEMRGVNGKLGTTSEGFPQHKRVRIGET